MLYDNGFLLEIYAKEHARSGDPQAARVVRETAAWVGREMTSPEGGFWSAIDAETHGHEGAYYVWTREEITAVLGEEDAAFLAPLLGFAGPPFFEGSHYVLHLPERLDAAAARRRVPADELLREVKALAAKLLAARDRRERPATDDKILADWNGMLIRGLAVAGALLAEPSFVERAAAAADFVLTRMRPAGGPLLHAWRQGQGRIAAYLADYAFLVSGLLALQRAQGAPENSRWLAAAAELTEEQIRRLGDPQGGFFVAGASPDLLFRSKDVFDGATPSASAVAVLNRLELAERTGEGRWLDEARRSLQAFATLAETHTDAVRMLTLAIRRYHEMAEAGTAADHADEEAAAERTADAPALHKIEEAAAALVSPRLHLEPEEEGGWRPFRLALEIEPGWHLQANPASEAYLLPTALRAEGAELRALRYPPGEEITLGFAHHPLAVYRGTVEIAGELGAVTPGSRLLLTFQPCDDARCLPEATQEVAVLPM